MVDPKVTNGKAQEILKSMNGKYDSDGNMTVEYFEQLEKGFLDNLERQLKKRPKPAIPEVPQTPSTQSPATEAPKTEAPKVEASQPATAPVRQEIRAEPAPIKQTPMHQAKEVVAPPVQTSQPFNMKQHSMNKLKALMESGSINEKGQVEVTAEQAQATLAPLLELMERFEGDDVAMLRVLEDADNIAKDKLMDPATGMVNNIYAPRAIQIWKQSLAKHTPATKNIRQGIIDRYKDIIPFTPEQMRADPYIEKATKEFMEVVGKVGGEELPIKYLGNIIGNMYLKYLDQDLVNLTNQQLTKRADAQPGETRKRKQPDGTYKPFILTEDDIKTSQHELRLRGLIQAVQNFLWKNYGVTTYIGASFFGDGPETVAKRAKDIPKLQMTPEQMLQQANAAEVAKSGPVQCDSSEFPEEDDENTYLIIER
jgi:hypothetical protein